MPFDNYIWVALCSVGAGFLTASIGFGGAVFLMLFFPLFLPFVNASGLASTIVYGGIVLLAIQYRRYALWKEIWLPILLYLACGLPMVFLVGTGKVEGLRLYFSLFVVLVGLYNLGGLLWPDLFRFKKNLLTTVLCSCLSGLGTGLFGIGGPPMAGYFMAVAGDDKNAYIGTIQSFFAISMVFTVSARFVVGIMPASYIPLALTGFVTSLLGKRLGTMALDKINARMLKWGICIFMILSQAGTLADYIKG